MIHISESQPHKGHLTRNSTARRFLSYLLLYFLLIFYLPRCTLLDFSSVSYLASLPFWTWCHRTTSLFDDKQLERSHFLPRYGGCSLSVFVLRTRSSFCVYILESWVFLNPFIPTVPTCAVRETASLGIMGAPRVPPLNPSESIVLSNVTRADLFYMEWQTHQV